MTCDLDRPCARCVKRNIGHLCHDEPREHAKFTRIQADGLAEADNAALKQDELAADSLFSSVDQQPASQQVLQETDLDLGTKPLPTNGQATSAQLVTSSPTSGAPSEHPGGKSHPFLGYSGWSLGEQNQFPDMHSFHPSYMFNAPEVTNEYNLLNDFLSTSLLDDDTMFPTDDAPNPYSDPPLGNTIAGSTNGYGSQRSSTQAFRFGSSQAPPVSSGDMNRSSSVMPTDKARETYYMTAADPAGSDTPDERMEKLLKAKYDAGMLRPFNYVKGYARLNQYMDKHMQPSSRQKILRGLDRFRPKFRERMQTLTDMQLVRVEMWFERSLMEYDRVFASMAIPACCWRRTGEIFRGNKEMAQLIHVPIEHLRDGTLAIHEIIVEEHLVSYWEKFEGIAFDTSQKAMLTSCSLKNPNLNSSDPEIRCCFSFTIRRDIYDMLEATLQDAPVTLPSLADSLHEHIDSVALVATSARPNRPREFDERGTRIWNLASKFKDDPRLQNVLALVRAFATLLLDRAQQTAAAAVANDLRVLKTALKASKHCLDQGQLGVTEQVVERAAFYEQRLHKVSQVDNTNLLHASFRRVSDEYYILRITLTWRQERLDLAEIWLATLSADRRILEAAVAEQLADVLFEIGRDQARKQLDKSALQWLDRAYDTLARQQAEELTFDATEVRCCIMHSTVHVLLKDRCEENVSRAWDIIRELEGATKNVVVVWLLKLELYSMDQSAAHDQYDILVQVVRQIHLSDANIKTILHHVHELRRHSPRLAHTVLVTFLTERLLAMEETAWVEKTLVTIVWNCTTSQDLEDTTGPLEELFDTVAAKSPSALGTSATHAAQILMLKRIEASYNLGDYDQADIWCRLTLHNLFGGSGASNIAKLQRKRILCALGKSDLAKCRDIRYQMSDTAARDPSTQYLLYRVALKCQDVDLAAGCLDSISQESMADTTLLYACVLEAQKMGDRLQVIRALSRVLETTGYKATSGLCLPALLRLTGRMLIQELESGHVQDQHHVDELCKVFEGAAAAAKTSRRGSSKDDTFPSKELDWFSRNSYNVALKMCTSWPPKATLRIVRACSNVSGDVMEIKGMSEADRSSSSISTPMITVPRKLQISPCAVYSVISLDAAYWLSWLEQKM
ncbi:MAG: hypothetical protein Q9200_000967 [Gallowayella weberi]